MTHVRHVHHAHSTRCSNHASVRMQQRCIPESVLHLLTVYGDETRTVKGVICYFSKRSRQCIYRELPRAVTKNFARYRNCYLIESDDGTIVTVGRRYKRIRQQR